MLDEKRPNICDKMIAGEKNKTQFFPLNIYDIGLSVAQYFWKGNIYLQALQEMQV